MEVDFSNLCEASVDSRATGRRAVCGAPARPPAPARPARPSRPLSCGREPWPCRRAIPADRGGERRCARRSPRRDELRQAPTWAITVNNIAFMCVPRAIPACFAATGWSIGLAALFYSSVVTYDTGLARSRVEWRSRRQQTLRTVPAQQSTPRSSPRPLKRRARRSERCGHCGSVLCCVATTPRLHPGRTAATRPSHNTPQVLGEVCALRPKLGSFPELMGEALAHAASRRGQPATTVEKWRKVGSRGCMTLQFATYYLTTVAELIFFEQAFGQMFEKSSLCQWQWLLIAGLISLPILQLPTFNATRWAAFLCGVVPLLINVAVMAYEVLLVRPWGCSPGPSYDGGGERSVGSIFLGLTAFSYAFGGHGFYPEEVREIALEIERG